MYAGLLRLLVRFYPRAWRERYGRELIDTAIALDSRRERSRSAVLAGVLAGGVGAWTEVIRARPAGAFLSLGGALAASATAGAIFLAAGGTTAQNFYTSAGDTARLEAAVGSACSLRALGRRVTIVEMNPTTGRVISKTVEVCPRRD
jgi:hypothetical protein